MQGRVPPALPLTHVLNAHFPRRDSFRAHSPFVRAETLYAIDKAEIHAHPTVRRFANANLFGQFQHFLFVLVAVMCIRCAFRTGGFCLTHI